MVKNFIKVALRNLARHKAFSFINIAGLAVSMSVCLLIIMIVKDQMSFDRFHSNLDRIYRINTDVHRPNGEREPYAGAPMVIAPTLLEDYTIAEEAVRIRRGFSGDLSTDQSIIPVSGLYTDQSFFNVFDFSLKIGNRDKVLTEPFSVVLTTETAEKFFKDENPLGQTMTLNARQYTVTGVLEKLPGKTHIEFEALASFNSVEVFESKAPGSFSTDNWTNLYSGYVYIMLADGKTAGDLQSVLPDFEEEMLAASTNESLAVRPEDQGYTLNLIGLADITPGPILSNNLGSGMPIFAIYFLAGLALIITISAGFNYTNLSIARSLTRAKEIGVRKVTGAKRIQIFGQFITESTIYALAALLLAYVIMRLIWPGFSQLELNQFLALEFNEDPVLYLVFIGFALFVGLTAGFFPALYLSSLGAARVLKGTSGMKMFSRLTMRKALIVAQFTISLLMIISVRVLYNQNQFVLGADYGINRDNLINVTLQGNDFDQLKNSLEQHSSVTAVGGISHALGTWADRSEDVRLNSADEPLNIRDFSLDNAYLQNIEVKLLAGDLFPEEASPEREQFVILNQVAVEFLNLGEPIDAIGKSLILGDSTEVQVVGVTENFNFRPLTYNIGPLLLRYKPQDFSIINLKTVSSDPSETLASLEEIWKKHDKVHDFDAIFFDDELQASYAGMQDIVKIVGFASFLAILVAALGLLGMAIYSAETKVKEVGIRRVLGATVPDIAFTLSKSFMMLIAIAVVLATPLAYFLNTMWLEQIAFHINVSAGAILFGVAVIVLLSVATVGSQTLRAAKADPVNSLRDE